VTVAALLEKLLRREDLSMDEATAAMDEIMEGRVPPSQIAGLLVALAMKGERPAEIVGFARSMRARATKLSREYAPVFDTCGTGGDRAHTFNVSTVAALVLAACGVTVAKHGNRSVSSRCGSADLFEALGVNVSAEPAVVERCLGEAGIAFFFAPTFHPSMRHAGPTRRELGLRTAFNLLGPLTNPAHASRQLVGVPRPELTELVARSLALLGTERAWVVHGADGLDEISTTGYTKVSECRDGEVNTFYLHPSDLGLQKSAPEALRGGTAEDNAIIARRVLSGEPGPQRDVVLLNAAAALLIAGRVDRIRDGLAQGAAAIDSGRAAAVLEDLRRVSASPEAARA
jgi:anthranilate phosphoribosyltransferase